MDNNPLIKTRKGFTLVELSIVIVIVGLIIAGVTAGKNLVRTAKLRSVMSELNQYRGTINSFRLQYNALPGDWRNANSIWPNCGGSEAICNGDGNGLIAMSNNTGAMEMLQVWLHLSLAKLIPGSYTGQTSAVGERESKAGENAPASSFSSGIWAFHQPQIINWWLPCSSSTYPPSNLNYLYVGLFKATWAPTNPIFTATEAQAIDIKMDDGISNKGKSFACDRNTGDYSSGTIPTAYDFSTSTQKYILVNYLN